MFGEVVRVHRTRVMLTQEQLAATSGMSVRHLREIESGRVAVPRASTVRLLAEALGLSGDERAAFQRAAREARSPERAVAVPLGPAQLPAGVTGFAGRAAHLAAIDAAVDPVVLVVGAAGVGKTTLALRWAHAAAGRFPDGQLYVNLRGFDPARTPVDPSDALHGFLDALGAGPRIPADRDARAALYRSLLARRRMLIVLDNASGTDQVRPLLPGNPACRVLVTSRDGLTGLVVSDAARQLSLPPMDTGEARELLSLRLGEQRVAAEPAEVDRIIDRCQRLPIALALVGARLAAQPGASVRALAAEIDNPASALDGLAVGDASTDIRAVFSWSYRTLSEPAARLFRLFAVHPGPDISIVAAASLAGLPVAGTRPLIAELARNHLVHEPRQGRFEFHDLLRAYATELAAEHESITDRDAALLRALDHYVGAAALAAGLLLPHRDAVVVPPGPPGVVRQPLDDRDAALDWFTTEHQVLLAMFDVAVGQKFDEYVGPWCQSFVAFAYLRGHWHDELHGHRGALAVAERNDDPAGQARALLGVAVVFTRVNDHDEAERHFRAALVLFERVGDDVGAGHAHSNLARVQDAAGRYAGALRHAEEALRLYTKAGHRSFRARAMSGLAWHQVQAGDLEAALRCGTESLPLLREIGDRDGEAAGLDTLGYAHSRNGDHDEAITCYRQAADMHRDNGDRYNEALVLSHIGDSQMALGRTGECRATWTTALRIFTDLDHPDADGLRRRLADLG